MAIETVLKMIDIEAEIRRIAKIVPEDSAHAAEILDEMEILAAEFTAVARKG